MAGSLATCATIACCLSCASCAPAAAAFARAERATYRAVAPEYLRYVASDAALDAEQKLRRRRTVETWDLSLRAHEPHEEVADVER